MDETKATKQVSMEAEVMASQRARDRANVARWDLDVAVFLFAILIIVLILLFEGMGIEVVAPIALFGLVMVWLVGWRRARQLYKRFYAEELFKLKVTPEDKGKELPTTSEETIEEKVQRVLRERLR